MKFILKKDLEIANHSNPTLDGMHEQGTFIELPPDEADTEMLVQDGFIEAVNEESPEAPATVAEPVDPSPDTIPVVEAQSALQIEVKFKDDTTEEDRKKVAELVHSQLGQFDAAEGTEDAFPACVEALTIRRVL